MFEIADEKDIVSNGEDGRNKTRYVKLKKRGRKKYYSSENEKISAMVDAKNGHNNRTSPPPKNVSYTSKDDNSTSQESQHQESVHKIKTAAYGKGETDQFKIEKENEEVLFSLAKKKASVSDELYSGGKLTLNTPTTILGHKTIDAVRGEDTQKNGKDYYTEKAKSKILSDKSKPTNTPYPDDTQKSEDKRDTLFSIEKRTADVSDEIEKSYTQFIIEKSENVYGNSPDNSQIESGVSSVELQQKKEYFAKKSIEQKTAHEKASHDHTTFTHNGLNTSEVLFSMKKQQESVSAQHNNDTSGQLEKVLGNVQTVNEYGTIILGDDDLEEKSKKLASKGAAQFADYAAHEVTRARKASEAAARSQSSSSFKTNSELSNYSFTTQSSESAKTFNAGNSGGDVATGAISAAASKVAQETSSSEDEARKKQFFIDTAVATGKIVATGGADTGEAVVSFTKSQLQQQKAHSDNTSSIANGNGSFLLIILVVIILVIVSSVMPVITVAYPFYTLTVKTIGFVDKAGNFIEGTLNDIKNTIGDLFNINDYQKAEKEELVDSKFKDTIKHYSKIMDDVVKESNKEIATMFGNENIAQMQEESKYNYDMDGYNQAYSQYVIEHMQWQVSDDGSDEPQAPNKSDYITSEKPKREQSKFEGYFWSDKTEGTSIPYGKLYDEVLCIAAAYNDSLMTDGKPVITYKEETVTDPDTGEEHTENVIDKIEYEPPSNDITYLTDSQVENLYRSGKFWDLSVYFDTTTCAGCETEIVHGQKPSDPNDPDSPLVDYTDEIKYCPGHVKGIVTLTFNWDTTELVENLHAGSSYQMYYDMVWEQYQKDKTTS